MNSFSNSAKKYIDLVTESEQYKYTLDSHAWDWFKKTHPEIEDLEFCNIHWNIIPINKTHILRATISGSKDDEDGFSEINFVQDFDLSGNPV